MSYHYGVTSVDIKTPCERLPIRRSFCFYRFATFPLCLIPPDGITSDGGIPKYALKLLAKFDALSYPHSFAAAATVYLPDTRSSRTAFILSASMYFPGVVPVQDRNVR